MSSPNLAPALSVVAPCFNEEYSVHELHRRVRAACEDAVGGDFEVVLVNDGSRDGTWPAMVKLAEEDPHVVAVNLSRNHGHQLALSAGLTIARGRRILIIDADLQDPPELLGEMMEAMDQGYDVVYGQRLDREGETAFKRHTAALFYRLLRRLVDVDIPVDTGDFRLMSRRAVELLNAMPEQHRFIRGMVSWIGLPQRAVTYRRQSRFAGESKYPLAKMMRFALDAITGFSTMPLRVASYLGIVAAFAGLLLLAYAIASWLSGDSVPGWTSLMVIVLIMGSAQLFVIGVLGEYLGRAYIESKRRPLFIIDRIVGPVASPSTADAERAPESR
jgi:dolichol-phosphate mannosyltransferase